MSNSRFCESPLAHHRSIYQMVPCMWTSRTMRYNNRVSGQRSRLRCCVVTVALLQHVYLMELLQSIVSLEFFPSSFPPRTTTPLVLERIDKSWDLQTSACIVYRCKQFCVPPSTNNYKRHKHKQKSGRITTGTNMEIMKSKRKPLFKNGLASTKENL